MAELRKIVRRDPISDFRRVAPVGGTAFAGLAQMAKEAYEWMAPAGVEEQQVIAAEAWREYARSIMGDPAAAPPLPGAQGGLDFPNPPPAWAPSGGDMPPNPNLSFGGGLLGLVDQTEGGGDYSTLFGHSQREGGPFAGVDVARMTIGQALEFADPSGPYAQWVLSQVGRVATPMGRFQIVGSTLRSAVEGMGLALSTPFNAQTQGAIAGYLARQRLQGASTPEAQRAALRNEWEGFRRVPDDVLQAAIDEFMAGGSFSDMPGAASAPAGGSRSSASETSQDAERFMRAMAGQGWTLRPDGIWASQTGDTWDPTSGEPAPVAVGEAPEGMFVMPGQYPRTAMDAAPRRPGGDDPLDQGGTRRPPAAGADGVPAVGPTPAEMLTAAGWTLHSNGAWVSPEGETWRPGSGEPFPASVMSDLPEGMFVMPGYYPRTGQDPTPLRIGVTDPIYRPQARPGSPLVALRPPARPNPTGTPETEAVPATRPQARPIVPETTIRTAEGRLAPRLYSPLSGPILQAYNAAAGVAFVSEAVMRGREDLMALSQQFLGNPDGFRQAAEGYLEGLVEQAPVQFREDLRAEIATEVHRRYLGMVDERYREIRERADNSSRALMDRYATDLAEAYASGRPEDIAAAEQALEGILVAREQLPGVAWTREQSQNVVLETMREGERLRARAGQERSDALKVRLQTIIDAAEAGRSAADEAAVLADPSAAALHPELYAEAQAMTALRDALPSFRSATPAEQAAAIAQERARPIGERFELGILDAMESVHAATVSALDDDPIAWAQQHRPSNPPPPLPTDMTDLAAWENALTARRDYALGMVTDGYVDEPLFFTEAERDAFTALIGDGTDPIARAAIGLSLTRAFGSQAGRVMTELDAAPVLRHSAAVVAAGGSEALIAEALRGQQLLDDNVVRLPPGSLDTIMPEDVRAGLPEGFRFNEALVDTIHALYAARAQGVDPSSQDATDLLTGAIQSALGQETHARGRLTGGVQEVGEQEAPTLLPPGISARQVEDGLTRAIGGEVGRWGAVVPMFDGQPLTTDVMDNARLVPIVRNGQVVTGRYRIEVLYSGAVADVEDGRGNIFILDMGLLTRGVPR